MFGLKTLATFALAASSVIASPLAPRQNANAILSGLDTVNANLIKLNQTFNKFTPFNPVNLAIALQILQVSNTIEANLKDLESRAKAIQGTLSDDDSLTIAGRVGELQKPITSTLNNIVVKKPYIRRAIFGFGDLSKTVLKALQTQRQLIGNFGNALTPKIAEAFRDIGPGLTQETQNLFNTAIAAYEKCSGAICLPPIGSTGSSIKIPSSS